MNKKIVLITLIILSIFSIYGEDKPKNDPLIIKFDLDWIGAKLTFGYRLHPFTNDVDTILWAGAGGAYNFPTYYRDSTGRLMTAYDAAKDPNYTKIKGVWTAGFSQGILWNKRRNENLVDFFVLYRGQVDSHIKDDNQSIRTIYQSSQPDKNGIIQNAFIAGFSVNDVVQDRHLVREGYYAEISGEMGPAGLQLVDTNTGTPEYTRLNFTAKCFLPLYDADPTSKYNVFSLYLADFVAVDYLMGANIPTNVQQRVGGLSPREGMGHAVRGIDTGRYDGDFKAVNNIELRANFPAIVFAEGWDVVFGCVAYFDAGYYHFMDTNATSGLLMSTGVGLSVDLFRIVGLVFYTNYYLNGENLVAPGNNGSWTPFKLGFGLHF